MALTFQFDPIDVDVPDAAERATWGSLQIVVEGTVLTRAADRYVHNVRDRVDDTILPLAEWIARNWLALTAVVWPPPSERASRRASYEWRRTHRLRMAGQGVALPDVAIWRSDRTTLSVQAWRDVPAASPEQRVHFLADLRADLPIGKAKEELARLVDLALRRCQVFAPDHPRTLELESAWKQAQDRADPAHALAFMAARAGRSFAQLRPDELDAITSMRDDIAPWLTDSLLAIDASPLSQIHVYLRSLQAKAEAAPLAVPSWTALRTRLVRSTADAAWDRGWADAEALRDALGISHEVPAQQAMLWTWLPPVSLAETPLAPADSIVVWARDRAPIRSILRDTPFRSMRDRWAACFGGTTGSPSCVPLGPRGNARSTANAFATELLAPWRAITRALAGARSVQLDDIDELSENLGAPATCVEHQIRNRDLAFIEDR